MGPAQIDLGSHRPISGAQRLRRPRQLACACECATPSPMMITGFSAPASNSVARAISAGSGTTRVSGMTVGRTGSSFCWSRISCGTARNVGPKGGVAAILVQRAAGAAGLRVGGARRVLGDRAGEGDEIEPHVRLQRVIGDTRLAGDHDQRRALLAKHMIETAQRVAEADAGVDLHDGRLLRRQRIAVGEQHQRRFLKPEHVLDGGKRATSARSPSSLLPGLPNMW